MGGGQGATAPLVLLLIALITDALISGLPGLRQVFAAPMVGFRAIASWFDAKLNRARRGAVALRIRGALVALVIAAIGWGLGTLVADAAGALPAGWVLTALTLVCLLAQRVPIDIARGTARALLGGNLATARADVGALVRYDSEALDAHGVARAAIEGLGARFAGGLVGTVFWFLLAGLPGLVAYRAIAAAADVLGRPTPLHGAFGSVCARLDDALTLIPAMLAGLILALAALFSPGANPAAALTLWARDLGERGVHSGFRSEGALAGALGLALGGPRNWDGEVRAGGWIGDGRARIEAADVRRAVWLVMVAAVIVFLAVAAALALVTS
ncbi:MAG: cobalamin biosynthesis protein [Alphaproteobacteria bacterium]